MPLAMASVVPRISTLWPRMKMSPLVAGIAPDRILISVDLPAPLSPSRPTISRSRTSRLTSVSARTLPYDLVIRSMRTRGSLMASSSRLMPALEPGMQRHHAQDDGADEDVVGEAGHADQHDAVAHDAQDQDAEHGADDGAAAARQRGAADHHHGDDFELVAGAAVWVGRRGAQ